MSADFSSSNTPKFEQPPLVEVACGVGFRRLDDLLIPHYGLFWDPISRDFPICQHANQYGDLPEDTISALPLPRVWFLSQHEDRLLQLHNARFVYNWRRSSWEEDYPHFEEIFEQFEGYYSQFSKFVSDRGIGELEPVEYELTYTNHIFKGEGWETTSEIGNLFRDLTWQDGESRFLGEPTGLGWQATFALPDGAGELTAHLKHGQRRSDNWPVFVLTMIAKSNFEDATPPEFEEWFQVAHDWIVNGFADLTSEVAQELWKRA